MISLKSKVRILSIFTDEQLQNCVNSRVTIQLYVENELDYEGKITGFSHQSIITEDGVYLRGNCKVETNSNYLKVLTL